MAFLTVKNEDVINNTGIVLSGPRGSAGIYALTYTAGGIGLSSLSASAHTIALTVDGSVRGWGANGYKAINPDYSGDYCKDQLYEIFSGAAYAYASRFGTLVVLTNGDYKCIGTNIDYTLNPYAAINAVLSDKTTPVLSGVKKVVSGSRHTIALMADGTVRGWGNNSYRQACPTSSNKYWTDPTNVILENAVDIGAGTDHSIALLSDGTVRGWGQNSNKQAYPHSSTNPWTNVGSIVAYDIQSIYVGNYFNLATRANGDLVGWGYNFWKSVNPYSSEYYYTDVINPILTNVKQVLAGQSYTNVLLSNGDVVGYGSNSNGECYPLQKQSYWTDPTAVILSNVVRLSQSGLYTITFCILSDGSVRGWGHNSRYETYVGSSTDPWLNVNTDLFNVGTVTAKLAWGAGTAVDITADGDYNLYYGLNKITATVDFSELSSENELDNVRVEQLYSSANEMYNEGSYFSYSPSAPSGGPVWNPDKVGIGISPITTAHRPGGAYFYKEPYAIVGPDEEVVSTYSAPQKPISNEGDHLALAPSAGGSPIWRMTRTNTPVSNTHIPCGYWTKNYIPPPPTTSEDEEALVFNTDTTVYLAKLTKVGYTITEQVSPSLTGYIIGSGWDRVNNQFFVFEDDYTNFNLLKVATDGTVVSTVVLCATGFYYQICAYHVPENNVLYIVYSEKLKEGSFPNEKNNLYVYFWQFDESGVLITNWSKLLKSLDYYTEAFQYSMYPASIVKVGVDYKVAVGCSYYTYPAYDCKYSISLCSLVDGSFTEYTILSADANKIGQIVSIGTNLYYELYDTSADPPVYTGVYVSPTSDPSNLSFVVDLTKDWSYDPYFAAAQEDLELYVSDEGKVVDVNTGSILYQITEISIPYSSYGMSRTLITV